MAELQDAMDAHEFREWQEYFAIEPFGEERADLRAGIIASVIANAHRGKNGKRFSAKDFMPVFGKRSGLAKKTLEEMRAVMLAFSAQHNARQKK